MFAIALKSLRYRLTGFMATFVAVFLGAAIMLACACLMETGIVLDSPPQRLAAPQVVVTGQQKYEMTSGGESTLSERVRLDSGDLQTVRSVPGVSDAVGEFSFATTLSHGDRVIEGQPLGHSWESARLTPYNLTGGAQPSRPGEVVVDAGLAERAGIKLGDEVQVAAHGTTVTHRVTGIAAAAGAQLQSAVFFSTDEARTLAAEPDRYDSIGIFAAPGTDADALRENVEAALGGKAAAYSGADRGFAEFPKVLSSRTTLIIFGAVFGGICLLVTVFGVASTLTLSVQQRGQEMALMRAVGATPKQIKRMILGETLVISLIATALGAIPGIYLGRWIFGELTGNDVVPAAIVFHVSVIPAIVAGLVAIIAAVGAANVAGRRAAGIRPTQALAEVAVDGRWLTKWRVIGAVFFFVAGLSMVVVTMTIMTGPLTSATAGPASVLVAIGLALLGPGIVKAMIALLRRPLSALTGLPGQLALLNARATAVRMAAAITPVMLATGIAIANLYMQTTENAASQQFYTNNLKAHYVLDSGGTGVGPGLIDQVRGIKGVAGAGEFATSIGFMDSPKDAKQTTDGWPLQGVTASAADATTSVDITAGSLAGLTGNTIALPDKDAQDMGIGLGDSVDLRLGDGTPAKLQVVGLFQASKHYRTALLPVELVAAHTTAGLASQILVKAAPGTNLEQLRTDLTGVAGAQAGMSVADRDTLADSYTARLQLQSWVNYMVIGMIVGYATIAMVNSLVMSTAKRRREFGLQQLTGSTRKQVLRMVGVESALVSVIGIVLGTALSTITLVPYSLVKADTPFPSGSVWIYIVVVGAAAALAFAATIVPTWLAMRTKPILAVTAPA